MSGNRFALLVNRQYSLVLSSMLMSFVEMMLIRWTSSNINTLYFFTNFVLIASFLGIGIGFLRANKTRHYFYLSPVLLSLVVLLCYLFSYEYQPKLNPATDNLDYTVTYFLRHFYPVFLTLPIIFIAVTATMASIADAVARQFKYFSSLQAYRLEVFGTLCGIIVFAALSFIESPPLVWGVIVVVIYSVLLFGSWRLGVSVIMLLQVVALLLLLSVFYNETFTKNHVWSTYYKIEVKEFEGNRYAVNVNGLTQQVIESVAQRKTVKPFYTKPYEHMANKKALDNVLVIGAGTGGDVAIALSQGAKHIDAVEIDPMLYKIGKKLNPDAPYNDPRVSIHINDGRAFLGRTHQNYDLIIYALTDSLMLILGQSSLRLENYLYTLEGLTAASNHLKPNGIFAIYNYYAQSWLADRLANTLSMIYKSSPCIDIYSPQNYWATVLTASPTPQALECKTRWSSSNQSYEAPSTDNHPFIYLQGHTLTPLYIFSLIFIALLSCYLMKKTGISLGAMRHHFDLFLMGGAFLLLETKSVVSYALLFGTTWMVNSFVFIGILLSVCLAIEVVRIVKKCNLYFLYALLSASLLLAWLVPTSQLLDFSPFARLILATGLTFSPIFIANLIFADRVNGTLASTEAMGANLIGAVFGGLLEYSSLVFGYQHFSLIILMMYTMAFLCLVFHNEKQRLSLSF